MAKRLMSTTTSQQNFILSNKKGDTKKRIKIVLQNE
tara:strand:+ start:177 stop:284 length:108 start_codon:yes stop_codon:yes gene_type:complete